VGIKVGDHVLVSREDSIVVYDIVSNSSLAALGGA
jgi:hypothetical protein